MPLSSPVEPPIISKYQLILWMPFPPSICYHGLAGKTFMHKLDGTHVYMLYRRLAITSYRYRPIAVYKIPKEHSFAVNYRAS